MRVMANENNGNCVTLYSSKAHIFHINPVTKNSWLQKGEHAIPISFVATIIRDNESPNETSKRELRIIGTGDSGETVLDVAILPTTVFTTRSLKFVQWLDNTGTMNGLGFNSEAELTEFVETFQQLQRDILSTPPISQLSKLPPNSPAQVTQQVERPARMQMNPNNVSETNGRFQANKSNPIGMQYSNTLAHPGHQMKRLQLQQQQQLLLQQQQQSSPNTINNNGNTSLNNGNTELNSNNITAYPRSQSMLGLQNKSINNIGNNNKNAMSTASGGDTPDTENSGLAQAEWQIREQLKYENERLKQALEESSKNAGVWHNELLNLRTNNVKLTQALQESKAHVEEWERELTSLRDENKELKLRVSALESATGSEEYRKDLQDYKNYVEGIQSELRRKEDEIEDLQKNLEELELKAEAKYQNGQSDETFVANSKLQRQKLDVINAKMDAKISDLVSIQKEFAQLLEKMHY